MTVFELTHVFFKSEGAFVASPHALGMFESFESTQFAIQYYKSKPGFCDNPYAFSVRRRNVIGNIYNDTIFEVIVYMHSADYEFEYSIELGLFGSKDDANTALSVYCNENATIVTLKEIIVEKIIDKIILGRREWPEGFDFD